MTDSIQDKPFTVQVDGHYNRRDGKVVTIVYFQEGDSFQYLTESGTHQESYREDGSWSISGNEHEYDLISEYKEPTVGDTMIANDDDIYDEAVLGEMYPPIKAAGFATAEPQDEWGPWIGWNGGECPVDGDTVVEVSTLERQPAKPASGWIWNSPSFPITRYRVKLAPEDKGISEDVFDLKSRGFGLRCRVVDYLNSTMPKSEFSSNFTEWEMAGGTKFMTSATSPEDRIKKEPEVLTKNVWISEITACVLTTPTPDYQTRRAIITLTDGKLDIEWAD